MLLKPNKMKRKPFTYNIYFVIAIPALLLATACEKSNVTPTNNTPPAFSDISINGEQAIFDITIGFSQGVFRTSNSSGDLNQKSFKITSTGGTANLKSFLVTHAAGQKNATIRVQFDKDTDGEEVISIKPFDGNCIFNSSGRSMNASAIKSISTLGIEHELITVKDEGNGTGTVKWTSNNIYLLDGFVFVNEGQTLTIEEGTVIKGKAGQGNNASALIVARGGKIMAEGTADFPIIFTSEGDDLNGSVGDLESGLWGGIILLGNASLNTVPQEQQIEGIPNTEPRGIYGGSNDEDNSGVLKYISIRHGGTDIGEGNEINGLTLGGVGSNTILEYIEVFANKDDGVEIFGGVPQLNNIIAAFCGDDLIDYDQGFHGKGQFWLAVQGFNRGDRLGEHDGGTDPVTGQPYAIPEIYNATYVGLPVGAGKRVITFRDNAGGHYINSIFYHQAFGIDIELLQTECSYTHWQNGDLTIEHNIFYLIEEQNLLRVSPGDGVTGEQVTEADGLLKTYFETAGNEITDPGFILDGLTFNVIPSKNVSENMAEYPIDMWFKNVDYKGAFGPDENWALGWSLFAKYMN